MEEDITHDMFCVGLHHSYKYSVWGLALCQCSCITIPNYCYSHILTTNLKPVTIPYSDWSTEGTGSDSCSLPCDRISHISTGPDKDMTISVLSRWSRGCFCVCRNEILAGAASDSKQMGGGRLLCEVAALLMRY